MVLGGWRYECAGGSIFILSIVFIVVTVLYTWISYISRKNTAPLPPGPRGLPLVGNLPFLEPDLNRYLAELAKTYGPIFKLQLGTRLCVVLSSASVAKEALKEHDINFSDRDVPAVGPAASYGGVDMVWSPHNEHWRMIRRISVTQLLNNRTLVSLYVVRQSESQKLVETIESMIGLPIVIHDYINSALFDTLSGMLWGGSLAGEEKKQIASDFNKSSRSIIDLYGETNISDIFPFLAKFDLQKKEYKMKKMMLWFDEIFDRIIEQRIRIGTQNYSDFLQVLLQCREQVDQKNSPLTIIHIKAILMDMLVAGTKTSSTTLEWAFAELMRQPHLIRIAKEELEHVVGLNNKVEETHLPELPYINAIVKEALRLHPPAPFLIRRSSESCILSGYMIPKGTKIMLNAWAIQRDPEYWENPLDFIPERFTRSNGDQGDYKGANFSYIPFGAGRRICVGVPLAEKMLPYLLATLLYSFDWKLEEGAELDMSEAFGLDLHMKKPLVVVPTVR